MKDIDKHSSSESNILICLIEFNMQNTGEGIMITEQGIKAYIKTSPLIMESLFSKSL